MAKINNYDLLIKTLEFFLENPTKLNIQQQNSKGQYFFSLFNFYNERVNAIIEILLKYYNLDSIFKNDISLLEKFHSQTIKKINDLIRKQSFDELIDLLSTLDFKTFNLLTNFEDDKIGFSKFSIYDLN